MVSQSTLRDAISEHVVDGTCVYLGNFGNQAFAAVHEIIQQRRSQLHLVASSGGLAMDQLIGVGALAEATFAHCWSPVGPAPTSNFRRAVETGNSQIALHEMSLGLLNAALTAGAWSLPFMPVSDVLDETGLSATSVIETPWGPTRVIEALAPDVAIVHADAVDRDGNAAIRGARGETLVACLASRTTIVVAEAIVRPDVLRDMSPCIPGLAVSTIVEHPGAARPDGVVDCYPRDLDEYRRYTMMSRTQDGFREWLGEFSNESAQEMRA